MAATKTRRQPVDIQLRHGHITHRDAIWAAIRELREFGTADLEDRTRVVHSTIKSYLQGLERAGYIERIAHTHRDRVDGKYVANRWRLVRDVGVDAPRVTREGKLATQGLAREQMWRAMRIIGDFNYVDLAVNASTESIVIKPSDAKDYVKYLHKAGYLIVVAEAKPGHKPGTGRRAIYRLLKSRYTGPRPPMIQRTKQVFDPNTGKVVWPNQEGEA